MWKIFKGTKKTESLELGKRYYRRDGKISGEITASPFRTYPYRDMESGETYTALGKNYIGYNLPEDLIIEHGAVPEAVCKLYDQLKRLEQNIRQVEHIEAKSPNIKRSGALLLKACTAEPNQKNENTSQDSTAEFEYEDSKPIRVIVDGVRYTLRKSPNQRNIAA